MKRDTSTLRQLALSLTLVLSAAAQDATGPQIGRSRPSAGAHGVDVRMLNRPSDGLYVALGERSGIQIEFDQALRLPVTATGYPDTTALRVQIVADSGDSLHWSYWLQGRFLGIYRADNTSQPVGYGTRYTVRIDFATIDFVTIDFATIDSASTDSVAVDTSQSDHQRSFSFVTAEQVALQSSWPAPGDTVDVADFETRGIELHLTTDVSEISDRSLVAPAAGFEHRTFWRYIRPQDAQSGAHSSLELYTDVHVVHRIPGRTHSYQLRLRHVVDKYGNKVDPLQLDFSVRHGTATLGAPQIFYSTPIDDETGVHAGILSGLTGYSEVLRGGGAGILVVFNQPVLVSTFRLLDEYGERVAWSRWIEPDRFAAHRQFPDQPALKANTRYRLDLPNVTDEDGRFTRSFSLSFTTADGSDTSQTDAVSLPGVPTALDSIWPGMAASVPADLVNGRGIFIRLTDPLLRVDGAQLLDAALGESMGWALQSNHSDSLLLHPTTGSLLLSSARRYRVLVSGLTDFDYDTTERLEFEFSTTSIGPLDDPRLLSSWPAALDTVDVQLLEERRLLAQISSDLAGIEEITLLDLRSGKQRDISWDRSVESLTRIELVHDLMLGARTPGDVRHYRLTFRGVRDVLGRVRDSIEYEFAVLHTAHPLGPPSIASSWPTAGETGIDAVALGESESGVLVTFSQRVTIDMVEMVDGGSGHFAWYQQIDEDRLSFYRGSYRPVLSPSTVYHLTMRGIHGQDGTTTDSLSVSFRTAPGPMPTVPYASWPADGDTVLVEDFETNALIISGLDPAVPARAPSMTITDLASNEPITSLAILHERGRLRAPLAISDLLPGHPYQVDAIVYYADYSRHIEFRFHTREIPTSDAVFAFDLDPAAGDQAARIAAIRDGAILDIQLLAVDLPEIRGWQAVVELPLALTMPADGVRAGRFLPGQVLLVLGPQTGLVEFGGGLLGGGRARGGDGELAVFSVRVTGLPPEGAEIRLRELQLRRGDGRTERPAVSASVRLVPTTIAGTRASLDMNQRPGDQQLLFAERLRLGEIFPIEIHTVSAVPSRGWGGIFEFPADSLEYVGFLPGSFIPSAAPVSDLETGRVSVAVAALGASADELRTAGHVGTVQFRALIPGRSTVRLVANRWHGADGITFVGNDTAVVTLSQGEPIVAIDLDPALGNQQRQSFSGVEVGQEVVLQLHVRNGPLITGWNATVRFDASRLQYVAGSFVPGSLLPELSALSDVERGSVEIGGVVLGASVGVPGDGHLGSLTFRVRPGSATSTILLELEQVGLRLENSEVVKNIETRNAALHTAVVPFMTMDMDPREGNQDLFTLVEVEPEDRLLVQLHLRNAPAISGWSARIGYSNVEVRFVAGSFTPGRLVPGLVPLADARGGFLEVGGAVLGGGASSAGEGHLGTVAFDVLPTFPGIAVLRLLDVRLRLVNGDFLHLNQEQTVALVSGSYSVTAVTEGAGAVPVATRLAAVYPNPFNSVTSVRFDVADPGMVVIQVFDLTGRLVTTLARGIYPVGQYRTWWTGNNDASRAVASGIYLVHMRTPRTRDIMKVTLVK
jgi:hypothetical protein